MTTKQLDKIITRKTQKIFDLMGKGKITLQENMKMYQEMMEEFIKKYPNQMQEILATPPTPIS